MNAATEEILKRFRESWRQVESTYADLIKKDSGWDELIPVLAFIQKLHQDGEDNFFRLETSMSSLIISRSVDFGLRQDQKFIRIEKFDHSFEIIFRDGHKIYREYCVKDLEDIRVRKLLDTLKRTLVD